MKTFTIRAGFSFVMPNHDVKVGGDKIQLDDDTAALHLHKLEEEPDTKAPKKPAAKPSTKDISGTGDAGGTSDPAGGAGTPGGAAADPAAGAADPAAGAADQA